jgi:hypothetical protein
MTDELISLLERECNYLMHGIKATDLATLRQRIQKLFIELMKDPEFNPEAAKHVVREEKNCLVLMMIFILTPQHWLQCTVWNCNSSRAVTHSALY